MLFQQLAGTCWGLSSPARRPPEELHHRLCPLQVTPRKAEGDLVPVVPPRLEERTLLGKTSISLCV